MLVFRMCEAKKGHVALPLSHLPYNTFNPCKTLGKNDEVKTTVKSVMTCYETAGSRGGRVAYCVETWEHGDRGGRIPLVRRFMYIHLPFSDPKGV